MRTQASGMKLGAIVRRDVAETWTRRLAVALGVPTFGTLAVGITSALTLLAGVAIRRSLGLGSSWDDAGLVAATLVGVATAVAVVRGAMRSWDEAGRLVSTAATLAIGADGVRWGAGGRERFVRWSEVERVEEEPMFDGDLGTLVLFGERGEIARLFVEDSEDLVRAARRALEAFRSAVDAPLSALEPNGRDVAAWIEETKRLLDGASYRAAGARVERVVAIATSAAAPRAQRLGAAISLAAAPEALRAKVRVALVDTADAELRDVMEDALDGRRLDARAVARTLTPRR